MKNLFLIVLFVFGTHATGRFNLFDFSNFFGINSPTTTPPSTNLKYVGGLKKLGLVNVVGFNNNECLAKDGGRGKCTTAPMCKELGGIPSGTCADGYGICCIVQRTCQGSINTNSTYFVNPGYPNSFGSTGQCTVTLNRERPNICQIRLDFEVFSLAQPDVSEHRCVFDRFEVSGTVNQIPAICGDNPGQHMYLHIGFGEKPAQINILTSQPLGLTFPPSRNWRIFTTQIPCDYTNAGLLTDKGAQLQAPPGCLQYYTGFSGRIKSFNFNFDTLSPTSSRQLSNQQYTICVRQESGYCGIRYRVCQDPVNAPPGLGFSLGPNTVPAVSATDGGCVSDYITIPCASDTYGSPINLNNGGNPSVCAQRLCGQIFSSVAGRAIPSDVYSTSSPFEIRYYTDNVEASAGEQGNLGFCLNYKQQMCSSTSNQIP
ncbi:uncharacterized protein LOC136025094 [Artemia franciscana]|uniref:CUB domain-containing protein n=1 Tax=Artemia franciscana TaxID=6661 RepID=A0AA88L8P6_ARTSF|nr:hypothetical protein QYM36_011118 [Artemia franciscana]